jgi:hypothetical protein
MEMLSERYGWTPNQIRVMREDDIEDYIRIINLKEKVRKMYNKK